MSALIITRSIGGIQDNRMTVLNSSIYRDFVAPATWSALRLGMRAIFNGTTSQGEISNAFRLGFTGTNATIGWNIDYHGWMYTAAASGTSSFYHLYSSNVSAFYAVGSPTPNPQYLYNEMYFGADPNDTVRRMLFFDITKGSPNYTCRIFYPSVAPVSSFDVSQQDFLDAMLIYPPVWPNHSSATATIAFPASSGSFLTQALFTFNSVSSPMRVEVCDWAVAKVA